MLIPPPDPSDGRLIVQFRNHVIQDMDLDTCHVTALALQSVTHVLTHVVTYGLTLNKEGCPHRVVWRQSGSKLLQPKGGLDA
jgi:hypothetical protein